MADFGTESVLDERKMFSPAIFGSRPCWRTSVFLMSSLSLRLLERCKVCLFKTTPFSLCQKKINAVHKATFYFSSGRSVPPFCFSYENLFISHGLRTGTHVFVCWVDYLFWNLNVFVQKVLYEKVWIHTCTNIQFITRLSVCMYMHICVCMNICINWGEIYWPKTKVFTKSKARRVWYVPAKLARLLAAKSASFVFMKYVKIYLFCLPRRQQKDDHFNS